MHDKPPKPDTIAIERILKTTPDRAFRAWADVNERKLWDVPGEEWEIAEMEQDFREDGIERSVFGPKGQPIAESYGRFKLIEEGSRIVSSGVMRALDVGRVSSVTMLTVDFTPAHGGTKLLLIDQSVYLGDSETVDMRRSGWETIVEKYVLYVGGSTDAKSH